jgi:hypothetical protein
LLTIRFNCGRLSDMILVVSDPLKKDKKVYCEGFGAAAIGKKGVKLR